MFFDDLAEKKRKSQTFFFGLFFFSKTLEKSCFCCFKQVSGYFYGCKWLWSVFGSRKGLKTFKNHPIIMIFRNLGGVSLAYFRFFSGFQFERINFIRFISGFLPQKQPLCSQNDLENFGSNEVYPFFDGRILLSRSKMAWKTSKKRLRRKNVCVRLKSG